MKNYMIFVFILISCIASAQNMESLRSAFVKSYTYEANKQYQKASDELEQVYNSNSYELNLRLGWLKYSAGSYSEAISYYQKAIDLQSLSIEARLGIVYPLSVQNKWDEVLAQYHAILQIDSKNSLVNYRTALIYYNRKNYDEAKKHLEVVLQLYPFDFDSNVLQGWTLLALLNKTDAAVCFERALLYSPQDTSAMNGLQMCK